MYFVLRLLHLVHPQVEQEAALVENKGRSRAARLGNKRRLLRHARLSLQEHLGDVPGFHVQRGQTVQQRTLRLIRQLRETMRRETSVDGRRKIRHDHLAAVDVQRTIDVRHREQSR